MKAIKNMTAEEEAQWVEEQRALRLERDALALRVFIVPGAGEGSPVEEIARRLDLHVEDVAKVCGYLHRLGLFERVQIAKTWDGGSRTYYVTGFRVALPVEGSEGSLDRSSEPSTGMVTSGEDSPHEDSQAVTAAGGVASGLTPVGPDTPALNIADGTRKEAADGGLRRLPVLGESEQAHVLNETTAAEHVCNCQARVIPGTAHVSGCATTSALYEERFGSARGVTAP